MLRGMVALKSKILKYFGLFVVFFLLLNPETLHLAVLVDGVGLEIILLLIEIQLIAIIQPYSHFVFRLARKIYVAARQINTLYLSTVYTALMMITLAISQVTVHINIM